MCKQNNPRKIDKCMTELIKLLNQNCCGIFILACCCGHKKYNMSIICKNEEGIIFDLISMITIPRKKRFYVKDKYGYYYIPEVENVKHN